MLPGRVTVVPDWVIVLAGNVLVTVMVLAGSVVTFVTVDAGRVMISVSGGSVTGGGVTVGPGTVTEVVRVVPGRVVYIVET